jgi:ABC-type cobalt transport system substrate-binding protein
MENLDIVVLSSIVATLFIVFFIVVFREFSNADENTNKKIISKMVDTFKDDKQ